MKRYLEDKRIDNTWAVVKIEDLPENFPVITVREYPHRSIAEFHLEEYCLVPKNVMDKINPRGSEAGNQDDDSSNAKK